MMVARMLAVMLAVSSSMSAQTTWYVDDDAPNDPGPGDNTISDPLEDGTAAHPFDMVQEGIDAAAPGDEVLVLTGTYPGGINFNGKAITLRSTDPTDPAVVAATILDGQGAVNHVVQCTSGEGPDTVLSGFTVTGGDADGSTWPEYCGGGMLNENSSPTITHCVFVGNRAEYGGGMCNDFGSPAVSHCTFEANYAGDGGGGMWNDESSPVLSNCTFRGNYGWAAGGLYGYNGSVISVQDCFFLANRTYDQSTGNSGAGGAIVIAGASSCTLVDTEFMYNTTGATGFGIFGADNSGSGGALALIEGASAVITGCSFVANWTGDGGGGGNGQGGDTGEGAAIYGGAACSVTVTDCVFNNNRTGDPGWGLLGSGDRGDGGAVFASGTTSEFTGATFTFNHARYGGAFNGTAADESSFLDCEFNSNAASKNGGGLMSHESSTTIEDCTFFDNSAGNVGGGAMFQDGGSADVTGCAFNENHAQDGGGVGIYNGTSLTMTDGRFTANDVTYDGGAVWMREADVSIVNGLMTGNLAPDGGGLAIVNCDPSITNCTIYKNTATNRGGGLFNIGGNPTLTNCILWNDVGSEIYDAGSSSTVTFSCVESGFPGTGNIGQDPLFLDPLNGDYHLLQDPPQAGTVNLCVDGGDPISLLIAGSTRTDGVADSGIVDMGYHYPIPQATCQWYCGTGVNAATDGYVITSPALIGGTFSATVTGCDPLNVGSFLVGYTTPLTLMTGWGEVLVNIADPNGELLGMPTAPGNPATFALGVPNDSALAGYVFYTQAASFGGSICLHCAHECTVGY